MPLDQAVEREIRRIDEELRKLPEIDKTVAVMAERLTAIVSTVEELDDKLDRRDEERIKERDLDEERRKSGMRWRIVTSVSTVAVILTGVGILLAAFGVGGHG